MVSKEMWALGANRSVIRDLFEYGLQQAKVVGPENVFDYSLGNPSIPSPPQVNETVVEILRDMDSIRVHGYTSALGDMETRSAIAADLNDRYGAGIRPENLFICCGAAPGLIAIMRALAATPEAEFVAIAPFFPEYRPFAKAAGGNLVVVPADTEHFQVNLKALEQAITPHTQAVIVNSPNNPTGTVYTAETIRAVGQLLTRKGEEYGHPIYILADEPYRELVYGGVEVPFIPNLYDNTIVCYSYSKSLSLPGERIGYICVPDRAAGSQELYAAVAGAAGQVATSALPPCGRRSSPAAPTCGRTWRPTIGTGRPSRRASRRWATAWPAPMAPSICSFRPPMETTWPFRKWPRRKTSSWSPALALTAQAGSGSATASPMT